MLGQLCRLRDSKIVKPAVTAREHRRPGFLAGLRRAPSRSAFQASLPSESGHLPAGRADAQYSTIRWAQPIVSVQGAAGSRGDDPGLVDPGLVLTGDGLQGLLDVLKGAGHTILGPRIVGSAIAVDEIDCIADLPAGWSDEQDGGHYRLRKTGNGALFAFAATAQGWKRYLYPPSERVWAARRRGTSFTLEHRAPTGPRYALFGVRACDLAGLVVLDRVIGAAGANDRAFQERRRDDFIVAVDCARPGATCFCVSMGTGPAAQGGFDLALSELIDDDRHEFLVRAGSERGVAVLGHLHGHLHGRAAGEDDRAAAGRQSADAASRMGREMDKDAASLLRRNLEHRRWQETADRCLTCGNCTSVCPTCFCTDVTESTSLDGTFAERRRVWDSCFTIAFSFLHGGSIRQSAAARYRQWITHKLSFWHEQFGMSGCVGCGRCITWCPVGIDITEEVRAVRDSEPEGPP
jgi:sulfhydrogenase subunit beta (sulfur reductase)